MALQNNSCGWKETKKNKALDYNAMNCLTCHYGIGEKSELLVQKYQKTIGHQELLLEW
jgi:hypothetical protein